MQLVQYLYANPGVGSISQSYIRHAECIPDEQGVYVICSPPDLANSIFPYYVGLSHNSIRQRFWVKLPELGLSEEKTFQENLEILNTWSLAGQISYAPILDTYPINDIDIVLMHDKLKKLALSGALAATTTHKILFEHEELDDFYLISISLPGLNKQQIESFEGIVIGMLKPQENRAKRNYLDDALISNQRRRKRDEICETYIDLDGVRELLDIPE